MTTAKTREKLFTTRNLTFCAMFAALTAVCSQISVPLPMIPLNLALFSVFLCGALLGPALGTASQLVFLLLGVAGAPVFAGFRGGPSVLVGPTGGYLIGYLTAALLTGLLARRGCGFWRLCGAMAVGLVVCYAFGTAWFLVLTGKTLAAALSMCVLPFLPGDALKIAGAAFFTLRLRPRLFTFRA